MNIEEIRAEIPNVFPPYREGTAYCDWIKQHCKDYNPDDTTLAQDSQLAATLLVDWTYEAGLKRGGEISLSALNDVELRANPLYQKGYEAGKADGQKSGVLFNAAKQVGFDEAAKDPKAWYVLDKNGEPVHIGDVINSQSYREVKVIGFQNGACGISVAWSDLTLGHNVSAPAGNIEKVIPDTREKIKEELASAIWSDWFECGMDKANNPDDLAEQFISRIEALVD